MPVLQTKGCWASCLPSLPHTYSIPRTMAQDRLTLESSSPLPLQFGVEGVTTPDAGDVVSVPEVEAKAHTETYSNTRWYLISYSALYGAPAACHSLKSIISLNLWPSIHPFIHLRSPQSSQLPTQQRNEAIPVAENKSMINLLLKRPTIG